MPTSTNWQSIVASALDWEQGHATFDAAVRGLAESDRGKRPRRIPHSAWQLVEHIRITQHDLLEFCRNPKYEETLTWPEGYWPPTAAPPSDNAWHASIAKLKSDRRALKRFATSAKVRLTSKIPNGGGKTYLRTIILAVDHTSYHVGQIILVRRLLGAWPET